MANSPDPGAAPPSDQERDTSTERPAATVWEFMEPALWIAIVAVSSKYNFCWTVTSISFLVERLCWILVQQSHKLHLKCGALLIFLIWTVWCCSLTPLHVFNPTFMDLWAIYSNHPPLEAVRVLHDPGDSALVDVFAIHGLGSNPDSAWTAWRNGTEVRWLSDILPRVEGVGNMRVAMINHQTRWDANTANMRFEDHAAMILADIENLREGDSKRPIIFIAHSFGGLLLKKALIKAKQRSSEIADHTRGILFLGVPHGGSKAALWASLLSCTSYWRGSSTSLLEYMSVDGTAVRDLQAEFFDSYVLRGGSNNKGFRPYICDFFEARSEKVGKFVLGPTVDGVSGNPRLGHIVYLDTDHRGMNKYFSADDPSFRRFHPQFRKAFAFATERTQQSMERISQNSSKLFNSVPLQTVQSYTERTNLSILLREQLLKPHSKDLAHAVSIYGLGGTGKTQLALRFLESHSEEYNPILWIDAENEETIRSSFKRCAEELGLPVQNESLQHTILKDLPTVQAVLGWLRRRDESDEKWLVVVDNADNLTLGIRHIIPKGRRGSVIVTSRDEQSSKLFDRRCDTLRVDNMELSEASSLLLQHVKLEDKAALQEVQRLASKIADRLGCLALAVDLAGAYIGASENAKDNATVALQMYLTDYERHRNELLKVDSYLGLSSYDKTVWTVWDTTLEAINERYPGVPSTLLLTFLAFLDRSNIQDEVFRLASLGLSEVAGRIHQIDALPGWLQELMMVEEGKEWDSFHYREALRPLIRYSLLEPTKGEWPGVTMNSLVQWKAMQHKKGNRWDLWYFNFITCMSYQMLQEADKPQFRRHMVAHFPQVTMLRGEYIPFDNYSISVVLSLIGDVYNEEGRWEEAEELLLPVVKTRERVLGQEHPETLTGMEKLALAYQKQGRWKEAEELQVRVVATRKKVLGEDHPETLTGMDNLAMTYQNQRRWKEAEELQVQVVEMMKKVLGEEHQRTLTGMNNLAMTYQRQGRWKEAEELQVQVVEIRKKVLGEDHPETLTGMDNLASTYQSQERWKAAEELEVQVVGTRKKVQGEGHPDTLISMNNLATAFWNQGRWKEAEELEVQVTDMMKKVLGKDHPHTLIGMESLARTYQSQGQWKEAEELQVQVVEMRKKVLGEEHPGTSSSMNSLAVTCLNQRRWKEAEELLVQATEMMKMVLGDEHLDTLTVMDNLASAYKSQERWKEAEELQVQVIEMRKKVQGDGHLDTLSSMENLASIFWNQGRWKEAEELQLQVTETRMKVPGEDHPDTLTSMNNLAMMSQMYQSQGRWKEAKELQARVAEMMMKVQGSRFL